LRFDPHSTDPRRGFEIFDEAIAAMLGTGLLVQLVLYLSNVQHIAEVRGGSFLGVFAIERAGDLLDLGTGRYQSSTPLVASAMVVGFITVALVALREAAAAADADGADRARVAVPIVPAFALLAIPALGTLMFRLGPLAAVIVVLFLARRGIRRRRP
jgi:hypothetical protein